MFTRRGWPGVALACVCLAIGAFGVAAPAASAAGDGAASWIAGKLISGAGSGAADYVVGNLMARAGLDPTTNALGEIFSQLTRLSDQIKTLQQTSNKTLQAFLKGAFDTRYDQLEITTITNLQGDYACYLDANRSQHNRDDCRAHFKEQAGPAQLWRAANAASAFSASSART